MKFQRESEGKAGEGAEGEEGERETLARGSNDTMIKPAENPLSYTYVCLRNAVLVILEFSNSPSVPFSQLRNSRERTTFPARKSRATKILRKEWFGQTKIRDIIIREKDKSLSIFLPLRQ